MDANALVNHVWNRLGGDTLFYPLPEILRSGLNPAQRLLCLFRPALLTQRVTLTLTSAQPFIDLRHVAPRSWAIARVLLGDVTTDPPTPSNGFLKPLPSVALTSVARTRDWFARQGLPQYYWRHGSHWLGIVPRPIRTETLTLVYRALPTPLTTTDLTATPDVPDIWHPALGDMAAALVLLKEGQGESARAFQWLTTALGQDFAPAQRQGVPA